MRIAVISPFVDRRHGTERAVAELVEQLAERHGDQIELYAQRVADLPDFANEFEKTTGAIRWHRVAMFPGPYLVQFLSWLLLNRRARTRDFRKSGLRPDLVFSPGINAVDADVILVHAVFHRLAELHAGQKGHPLRTLHRRLYYALLCRLERRIYGNPSVALAAVSKHTARQLERYFGRGGVTVIPNGVDTLHFSAKAIAPLRAAARVQRTFASAQIVLLLVGNDWRNKGLSTLLSAMALCKDLPLRLLVVGQDDQAPFRGAAASSGLLDRVEFCQPARDVRHFYAAADILVAPSLEDSFNLPALEAMACGLPVIVSSHAGVSEWLTHGFDALLLKNPESTTELAEAIRTLATGPDLRATLAANAVATSGKFSWERHALQLRELWLAAAAKKTSN